MNIIRLTDLELDALASAAEEMVELVGSGRRWENEPPETLRALRRVRQRLLSQCAPRWKAEQP